MPTSILTLLLLAMVAMPGLAQELTCSLSLTSNPEKATVTCDGVLREETPLMLTGLLPGPHLILLEKAGYQSARRTVTLAVGQRSSLVVPLERLTGLVLIKSVPEGAEIEINGAHRGKAPLLVTDLPPGQYRMKASAAGYRSRDVEFEVTDRLPKQVSVSLASDSATLTVRSKPAGASVSVNGLSKGVTPCTLDRLPAGEVDLVLSLADFDSYRTKVKLQANESQELDVDLKAVPAQMTILTTPTGSKVFIDDVLKGQTPLNQEIVAGSHAIRVELDGYEVASTNVTLQAGEKTVQELTLSRNVGQLEVMAKPDGVTVSVDGVDKGTVMPGSEGNVGQLALELPVGDHKVVLSLKGYGTLEKRVTIQKGQTVSIKDVLKRVFVADTQIKLLNGDILVGVMGEKLPNGDVKLETQLGIYKTIKAEEIGLIESLKSSNRK